MTTSTLVAIIILLCSILDTVLMKWVLPGLLEKQTRLSPAEKIRLIQVLNLAIWGFFGMGVMIYLMQPFG